MIEQVQETLTNLNRAWVERRFDDMTPFLDEQVVMKGPGLKELAKGRDTLIGGYRQFMERSKVTEYSEANHAIDQWADTAVASYEWTIAYEQDGKPMGDKQGMARLVVPGDKRGGRYVSTVKSIEIRDPGPAQP